MEINNFRNVAEYDKEPPHLTLVETWQGYEIYDSSFSPLIRVVKKPEDQKYYAFENNGTSTDYSFDIKCVIRGKWKLPDED